MGSFLLQVVCVIIVIIFALIYITKEKNFEKYKGYSSKCNKRFVVCKSNVTNEKAVRLLCQINKKCEKFLQLLIDFAPKDYRTINLQKRFDGNTLREACTGGSHTMNKGEEISLCLKNRKTGEYHGLNLMMFVVIHELAHVACNTYGHNKEFWTTFSWFLHFCQTHKIIENIDFAKNPEFYCNNTIGSNPYFTNINSYFKTNEGKMLCSNGSCKIIV